MCYSKTIILFIFQVLILKANAQSDLKETYADLQEKLINGWGTYNHKSVLSHVLLPEGIALNIGIKFANTGPSDNYLREAFISSRGDRPEQIVPGPHAFDGSYSELTITWQQMKFRVQSATDENDNLALLVTPITLNNKVANVILEVGMLWNKPGTVTRQDERIEVNTKSRKLTVGSVGKTVEEFVAATTPYLAVAFSETVGFYTGREKTLREVQDIILRRQSQLQSKVAAYGNNARTFEAIHGVLAWNTIYDAARNRIITPVSRLWNDNFGGQSVLFCWDTYFASYMLRVINKDLAYANAIEITKAITKGGFVPNWTGSYQRGSYDRSQPPIGSFVLRELYRTHQEKWILEFAFDDLLRWNRWWANNRDYDGYLCWGSTPDQGAANDDQSVNTWQGAAYESGLDNSPMFDGVPFNQQTHLMEQADVGLMSLYILDCAALGEIARILNKKDVAAELNKRENFYKKNLQRLWSNNEGIFLNRRTDINAFSTEISPTNFYPLIAKAATADQAKRMINEHLLQPDEFNGEWMLPSISFKSPAFKEQNYWRGRIWAPMNFLVYLGLLNYDLPEARQTLAEKSGRLFKLNLGLNGWVFENYNAITGNVTNQLEGRKMGDNYYHWGALLGFIVLMQEQSLANSENGLKK